MIERSRLPADLVPGARTIAVAWTIVAIAYTPAVFLVEGSDGDGLAPGATFIFVALGFLPWALITRPLIALCAAAPLGSGSNGRSIAILGAAGLLVLPVMALTGNGLGQLFTALAEPGRAAFDLDRVSRAALINAFFSVPTYAAVIGVGQTLVYLDRTRTRERLLARARLDALRAQINPHFLFNALGAIAQLAHRDADTAERAIGRLSDVLRSTLASDLQVVPLPDEIASVMDQVELHRMLLPGQLDLRIAVAPAAWSATVPALILQPLVENAVTHGLSRLSSDAWLSIAAEVSGGRLAIEVTNACPIQPWPSAGLGLGLANVAERLTALHGDSAHLATEAGPESFRVRIELPFVSMPDLEDAGA